MNNIKNAHYSDDHPWWAIVYLAFYVVMAAIIFQVIGIFLIKTMINASWEETLQILSDPINYPGSRVPYLVMQGIYSLGAFLFPPLLLMRTRESYNWKDLLGKPLNLKVWGLVAAIVFCFFFVNAYFIQWNANVHFPSFMEGFEKWASQIEDRAQEVTEFLTHFDNPAEFLLGMVVIAVIPALGEELLFRGLLQNKLLAITKNHHIAIWTAAIVFSTVHFQFFGFVPRVFLGALFGYMYVWSGKLWVPVTAHFFNNGITLLIVYLNQLQVINYDMDETDTVSIYTSLIFAVLVGLLLYLFRKEFFARSENG